MAPSPEPTGPAPPEPPGGPNASLNGSWAGSTEPGALEDMVATGAIGALLSAMGAVGVAGNAYALVAACGSPRAASSLRVYVASLALADLLYLLGIPFVVATYATRRWHFGDAGCRVLVGLDVLTMHASIFTLTVVSSERHAAVLRPLGARRRSQGRRRALALGTWLLALLLALPMTLAVRLVRRGPKSLCLPAWGPRAHRAYLTLLFGTSIVGPGLVIGLLYARLARAYWRSQRAAFPRARRLPDPRVLYVLLGVVLLFWACFLPFWLWQLLAQHRGVPAPSPRTARLVNYLTACLTYGNSCANPFLYTLLTKSHRELRRRAPRGRARGPPRALAPPRDGRHGARDAGRAPSGCPRVPEPARPSPDAPGGSAPQRPGGVAPGEGPHG